MRPRHVRALLRRLAALGALVERAAQMPAQMPAPDNPGVPRENPAHQDGLPTPAQRADAPVNPGPGAASRDDAVCDTGKAVDPAVLHPARVPEPSVAARLLVEQARENLTAPADYATITAWGRANGVDVSGRGRSGVVIMRVNAKRRSFGLPAFRLVNSPRPAEAVTAEFHEMSRVRTA